MSYPVYYDGEFDVVPSLTEQDITLLLSVTNLERNEETRAIFESIEASDAPDLPWHAGLITVSEGGASISPEEGESRPGFGMWLELLIKYFFTPKGYALNGDATWTASDDDYDRGSIFIKDNQIEIVDDLIHNAGPSWNPSAYADANVKAAIEAVVDSADDTGCTEDLTVISSCALAAPRALVEKM
jgi:hypothetical protein